MRSSKLPKKGILNRVYEPLLVIGQRKEESKPTCENSQTENSLWTILVAHHDKVLRAKQCVACVRLKRLLGLDSAIIWYSFSCTDLKTWLRWKRPGTINKSYNKEIFIDTKFPAGSGRIREVNLRFTLAKPALKSGTVHLTSSLTEHRNLFVIGKINWPENVSRGRCDLSFQPFFLLHFFYLKISSTYSHIRQENVNVPLYSTLISAVQAPVKTSIWFRDWTRLSASRVHL